MTRKLDCQEAARLLSDDQENTLSPADRSRLRVHLIICETCRVVESQFKFLREAMSRLGKDRDNRG